MGYSVLLPHYSTYIYFIIVRETQCVSIVSRTVSLIKREERKQ